MSGKTYIIVGVIFLLFALAAPILPLQVIRAFTVKDAVTGEPIANAHLTVVFSFPGGGTMPGDAYSDWLGRIELETHGFSIQSWRLTAMGYEDASGAGAPPTTVYMTPKGAQPPTEPPPQEQPQPPQIDTKLLLRAVFAFVGVVFVAAGLTRNGKR